MKQFRNPILVSILIIVLLLTAICSSKATDALPKNISLTATNSPEFVWNEMKSCLATNNIPGAVACFSIASRDDYQHTFAALDKTNLTSFVKGLGPIKKVSIKDDQAQYYFENVVDGKTITFPVEFDKENGEWKIMEF